LTFTLCFVTYFTSGPSTNLVGSTIKIDPESDHFYCHHPGLSHILLGVFTFALAPLFSIQEPEQLEKC
jgi:hypothetical protein